MLIILKLFLLSEHINISTSKINKFIFILMYYNKILSLLCE